MDNQGSTKLCPATKTLKRWLDGRSQLSEEETLHIRSCEDCHATLDRFTEADGLMPPTATPAAPNGLDIAFAAEEALGVLQRDLVTPPHTPNSRFETMEETPSQVDSNRPVPARRYLSSSDTEWLSKHFDPGRYTFEGLIGRGGNADVFSVYDALLDKQFAIKTIASDSEKARLRMLREAKLMADIDHPNIVRVFDVGQIDDDGGPPAIFLVMEYMGGGTLLEFLVDGKPSKEIGAFRQLASLLAGAASGLALAHEKGVVHRDLKPANILLNSEHTVAKVADFGLASRDSDLATMLTRTGAIVGTPAFMSPEQASASPTISPASDVYSAGATLYFMLTGQTPFAGNPAAVARQIVDSDPASPLLLNPSAPRELVAICERAMEKEAAKRYLNIGEFENDLRAFAAGESVAARPVSAIGRVLRQLRRNRKLNIAVQSALAMAVIIVVMSVASAVLFRNQSNRLAAAAERDRVNKALLSDSLKRSLEAADQLLVSVTEDLALLPSSPGSDRISEALLERAKVYYVQFLDDNADNDELKYQLARAHSGLARIAFRLGDIEQGRLETADSLAMLESMGAQDAALDPAELVKSDLLEASTLLQFGANVGKQLPGDAKADQALQRSAEIAGKVAGQIDDISPNDLLQAKTIEVSALRNRSVFLEKVGRDEQAGELAGAAREQADELVALPGADGRCIKAAAMAIQTLGLHQTQHGELAAGAETIDDALAVLSKISDAEARALRTDSVLANLHTNRARLAMIHGEFDAATAEQALAIAIHERFCVLEPDVPAHKLDLVDAILNSTNIKYAQDKFDDVIADSKQAITVLDQLIGSDPLNPDYRQTKAMFQGNIAIVFLHQGKALLAIQPLTESIAELQRAAEELENSPGSLIAVAINHYSLAGAYMELGQNNQALRSLDSSDALAAAALVDSPDYTAAIEHLIDSLFRRTDVFYEQDPVDADAILETIESAISKSDDLIANEQGVLRYEDRHLLMHTTRGDASLRSGDLGAALSDAEFVILNAARLRPETFKEDFALPLMYAYVLKFQTLQAKIDAADEGVDVEEFVQQLKAARQAAEEFGALPEDFGE